MHGQNLFSNIDGTTVAPPISLTRNNEVTVNPPYMNWFRQDLLVQSTILASVGPTLESTIATVTLAHVTYKNYLSPRSTSLSYTRITHNMLVFHLSFSNLETKYKRIDLPMCVYKHINTLLFHNNSLVISTFHINYDFPSPTPTHTHSYKILFLLSSIFSLLILILNISRVIFISNN